MQDSCLKRLQKADPVGLCPDTPRCLRKFVTKRINRHLHVDLSCICHPADANTVINWYPDCPAPKGMKSMDVQLGDAVGTIFQCEEKLYLLNETACSSSKTWLERYSYCVQHYVDLGVPFPYDEYRGCIGKVLCFRFDASMIYI